MKNKNWKDLCDLKKELIPRNHKFYCLDNQNDCVNTFVYKFELDTFLKQNERDLMNFEIGKISYYNISNNILVQYFDNNNKLQKITFFEFEQIISFAKNKNFRIKNIEFIYE